MSISALWEAKEVGKTDSAQLATPKYRGFLRAPPPGAHVIFWSDGSEASDEGVEAYIRGGTDRRDLVIIVLPSAQLTDLDQRMAARGLDLDRIVDEGGLVRTATEDLRLHGPEDLTGLYGFRAELGETARSLGLNGLTLIDSVASPFFEQGNQRMAEGIERTVVNLEADTRALCVYRAQSLRPPCFQEAVELTRLHTHTVTALGGRRFFVEALPSTPALSP